MPRPGMEPLRRKTPAQFFGTTDLLTQLKAIGESDGYVIPAHICVEVCARAATHIENRDG